MPSTTWNIIQQRPCCNSLHPPEMVMVDIKLGHLGIFPKGWLWERLMESNGHFFLPPNAT